MADKHEQPSHENKIYDYPGRWTSRCWKFFGFVKIKPGPPSKETLDMKTAMCKLCRKSYANNANTSNFLTQIDTFHPDAELEDHPKRLKQPKLNFEKPNPNVPKTSTERKSILDDALAKLVVGKILPTSLVDNDYFKSFVGLLDPKYDIPSRRTLHKQLQNKQEQMAEQMKSDIRQCKSVAITHDGWTSLNTESYNTTTVHAIDNEWKLRILVLDTKKMEGSHTSEKIAETLIETKRNWNLPEDIIATTDNAANEKRAFTLLNWERFGCYGHRINLIVRHALNVPEVNRLLTKARKLVTFFHTSSSCSDMLKMKQQIQFPPPSPKANHKLIMDVVTRWNSTIEMLQRVVELMPAIVALVNDDSINLSKSARTTIKTQAFSCDEIALAEKIAAVLEHFKNATDILCAENSPTTHKVLPVVVKLSRELKENENDPPEIKELKMNMNSELLKRTESEDIALAACVLNPYTKGFEFMPERREEAHTLLRRLAVGVNVIVNKETEENNNIEPALPVMLEETEVDVVALADVPPPKMRKVKSADTEDWLDDVVCTGESTIDEPTLIEKELNTYLISKVEHNMTVLQWWKGNENMFPRLSKLAKQFLCVPASSVPSERVFSLAGSIVNKKRSRLTPENVNMFIYLNKNIEQYW